jgi:mannose-6-phosphate isomerase-like protein (cupin superfamily)
MTKPISRERGARHYTWGGDCDGWVMVDQPELSVISERMPANRAERRHHHISSRQFFHVTHGTLTMEVEGAVHHIDAGGGIEIPPSVRHQARNETSEDIEFLVISQPTTRGDRIDDA